MWKRMDAGNFAKAASTQCTLIPERRRLRRYADILKSTTSWLARDAVIWKFLCPRDLQASTKQCRSASLRSGPCWCFHMSISRHREHFQSWLDTGRPQSYHVRHGWHNHISAGPGDFAHSARADQGKPWNKIGRHPRGASSPLASTAG